MNDSTPSDSYNYFQNMTATFTGVIEPSPPADVEYGITWSNVEPVEWQLIAAAIDAERADQKKVVADLIHHLEWSFGLAMDALLAIADAGFIITKKASR